MIRQDNKSRVLDATDIVSLIGKTVALKKVGRRFLGLCPFHSEKTPSFNVDPERRFFYCFGCKAAGNAIDFVMKRDRVEFREGLEILAREAGIELLVSSKQDRETASQRQQLLDAHAAAQKFFRRMLLTPDAKPARDYLAKRGFTDSTLDHFRVGFAPDSWDAFLTSNEARPFDRELLMLAGLAKKRESGDGCYDTFRARIMFPIRDEQSRPIAFGGRILPGSDNPAKYLNSPETPLFSKSRSIFGFDLARDRIRSSGTVVVVEGYTDVVMAHQYGVTNVVSILGTALTEQHVNLLKRFAQRIVLLFDADTAGQGAAERSLEAFLAAPIEIGVATLPAGLDPDELLLKEGPAGFEKVIENAVGPLEYFWHVSAGALRGENVNEIAQQHAIERFIERVARLKSNNRLDPVRIDASVVRLGQKTGIPLTTFLQKRQELARRERQRGRYSQPARVSPAASEMPVPARPESAREKAERLLLGAVLAEPARWIDVQKRVQLSDLAVGGVRRLAEVAWEVFREEGPMSIDQFIGQLEDELKPLAVESVHEASTRGDLSVLIDECLAFLSEQRQRDEEQRLRADLQNGDDDALRRLAEKARRPDMRRSAG